MQFIYNGHKREGVRRLLLQVISPALPTCSVTAFSLPLRRLPASRGQGFQGIILLRVVSPCSDSAFYIQVCDFHRQEVLTSQTKAVMYLTLASLAMKTDLEFRAGRTCVDFQPLCGEARHRSSSLKSLKPPEPHKLR